MITDRQLEDYHDEALSAEEMAAISESLRCDPSLREKLAAIAQRDEMVREALTAPVGSKSAAGGRLPIRVLAAAAAIVFAAAGVWVLLQQDHDAPAETRTPRVAAKVDSGSTREASAAETYEPVRMVFSLPASTRGERVASATPAPVKGREAEAPIERVARLPETRSKAVVRATLASLPLEERIETCRAWAAEDRSLAGFIFDYLDELGQRDDLAHELGLLGVELGTWPEMEGYIRSFLPPEQPRPSSSELPVERSQA